MASDASKSTARLRVSAPGIKGAIGVASFAVDPDGHAEVDAILFKMAQELNVVRDRARQRIEEKSGGEALARVVAGTYVGASFSSDWSAHG